MFRYAEILKRNCLLPSDELDASILQLKDQYPGLPLPGDIEALEDIKQDIIFKKEKISMLNNHEETIMTLVKQNE